MRGRIKMASEYILNEIHQAIMELPTWQQMNKLNASLERIADSIENPSNSDINQLNPKREAN